MESSLKRVKTEIKIQESFIKLLNKKGFNQISVKMITENALISRGTFYLHYLDKYDLLEHYENEIINTITNIFHHFPKPSNININYNKKENDAFYKLFNYLYRQRNLTTVLIKESNSKLISKMKKLINDVLPKTKNNKDDLRFFIPDYLARKLVVQEIIDFFVIWLSSSPMMNPNRAYIFFKRSRFLSPRNLIDKF